ncbi:MAG: hypothetical protein ACM3SY_10540 [Candidatus Omnitrophota bacterium]
MKNKKLMLVIFSILLFSPFIFTMSMENSTPENEGLILRMNNKENQLIINDTAVGDPRAKVQKVFFNGKDYTDYIKDLMKSNRLAFGSSRFLIFGETAAALNGDQVTCAGGTIFIPGETENILLDAKEIRFDENTQILNAKEATVTTVLLSNNQKEQKSMVDISLDLKKMK